MPRARGAARQRRAGHQHRPVGGGLHGRAGAGPTQHQAPGRQACAQLAQFGRGLSVGREPRSAGEALVASIEEQCIRPVECRPQPPWIATRCLQRLCALRVQMRTVLRAPALAAQRVQAGTVARGIALRGAQRLVQRQPAHLRARLGEDLLVERDGVVGIAT
ncbi:MAG: hypothetical protein IPK27_09685 [Rhodanobacteraceae bacterium]|nr:hypothetical protein [Rhodanobacteraceae bacterium]